MVSKLDHALALALKGFKVFPIRPGAKAPPLLNGWPQKATSDPELVRQYWTPLPDANIGIHCENMAVIDVDPRKGGNESLQLLELTDGLPPTLTNNTPTGGRHLFFVLPEGHAGVPNSVGELGDGLDVRSTGGYVVAPGSEVEAGAYAFEHDGVAIAQAPAWLIDRLGTPAPRPQTVAPVADAPDAAVEAARTWLQGAERSVKGSGGDQAAYRVACALRDRGVSYQQACELMRSEAWDYGCGWRGGWLEDKPIRSAYRYATGEPGSRVALPADFPIVPETGTIVPKKGTLLSLSEFANQEARTAGYAVKGLLQRASYASIYGAPGEGKTFVALDIAYHVAAGREWMGRKVHAGPVLYLAYEGAGGMVKRAKALRQKYGNDEVPLFIASAAYNLRDKVGRADLGTLLLDMPNKPVLIVVDTFARALMGGDENSAQDVGAFNGAIAALIQSTQACVAIIHHSGKDKSRGARGSSALLGALDSEIEVDGHALNSKKQRDIELAPPIGFKLAPMVVGIDEDGDESTSCVVEPASIGAAQNLPAIRGNNKRGFDTLCILSPDNTPVTYGAWREACKEFLGEKSVTARFSDIKRELVKRGYVDEDDKGLYSRRCE